MKQSKIYKQIFTFFVNFLKTIKRFAYIIIIVALIGFNVLTLTSAAVYTAAHGLFSSLPIISSLFTDSVGNINKKQQIKIKKSKKIVKKQRELIKKRTVKQTAKKTAAAAIPFAGAVIVAGIGANEYCNQLDDNIALSNTLNDTNEKFNYDVCFNEVKKDMGNLWQSFKNLF